MAHNLHHPSGMPYHIYHNVMGGKAMSEATQRGPHIPSLPNSSATVLLPTKPLALSNQVTFFVYITCAYLLLMWFIPLRWQVVV